jgi:hypothetical protein
MRKIAELTDEQVAQAWTFAQSIKGENQDKVRHDYMGARIHRDKYNVDDPYGWIVEYILDEEFLRKHSKTGADIFCEANVRILFFGNWVENTDSSIREVADWFRDECGCNIKQYVAFFHPLTPNQKEQLQLIYGLSDEIITSL